MNRAKSGRKTSASGRKIPANVRKTSASGRKISASVRKTSASGRKIPANVRKTSGIGRKIPAIGTKTSVLGGETSAIGTKTSVLGTPGNNGAPGAPGQQGPPFAQAVVDGVSTLNPGDSAQVSVSFDGSNVHFSFAIPRGNDGNNGMNGANGSDGATGPQGPAFANAIVDSVTTVNPGDNAALGVTFDGSNVHFAFAIPRGADGLTGPQGIQGNDGQQGIQGPPGEVTAAQLNTAIAGTSNNTNAVATLDTPFADPDMEAMRAKMNELILAMRR